MPESSQPFGPVAAPWGVPVLLAPFYACFRLDFFWLKLLNVICYGLFVATSVARATRNQARGRTIAHGPVTPARLAAFADPARI